jgi:hypothetical protein
MTRRGHHECWRGWGCCELAEGSGLPDCLKGRGGEVKLAGMADPTRRPMAVDLEWALIAT